MKRRHPSAILCSLVCAAMIFSAPVDAAPINGLVIFGDSLSDPGNNANAMGSTASPPFNVTLRSDITSNSFIPTYPYASSLQYSNGNVWAYQFATMLELSSEVAGPVRGGGLGANYAYGNAATGPVNNSGFPPSLLTQTGSFVASLGSAQAPANALYVVAGGGNNARTAMTAILSGSNPAATIVETASQFAADIGSIVDTLQAKGAENIIVWTAPNLGLSPAITAYGRDAASLATTLTYSMNAALAARLASETDVRTFDFFGLITSVNANPGAYGLTNVSDAGGAVAGADLSTYLCWDGVHPTAAGHAILAQSMYDFTTVPEIDPTGARSVVALVVGCLSLIERRRLRGI